MTYTGTLADCRTLATYGNKCGGYPLIGRHVGLGIHVPMPAAWDGIGVVPPGWTAYSDQSIVADRTEYVIPMEPTLDSTELVGTRLTVLEQTELAAIKLRGVVSSEAP